MTLPARVASFFFLVCLSGVTLAGDSLPSPWTIDFDPARGLSVRYEGIPVIRENSLYVVEPGWTAVLYNQEQVTQEVERFDGKGGPGMTFEGSNETFTARHRIEVLDENRLRITMEGRLKEDIPVQVEYPAGFFNANLLAGVPFRAETKSGPKEGRVQDFPATIDQTANDVAPDFRWIEFDSRLGKMRVQVDAGDERVMFFDARRDPQGWADRAPIFWCGLGVPARTLVYGEPLRFEMTVSIDPLELEAPGETAEFLVKATEVAAAQSPENRPLRILPTPKAAEFPPGEITLQGETIWSIVQPEYDARLSSALTSLLNGYGLDAQGQVEVKPGSFVLVRIGEGDPLEAANDADPEWLINPEGYFLHTDEDGITIISSTSQGAFYGIQTLAQLLRPSAEGVVCHAATIADWPSMQFRGAHWFPSDSGVPFHEGLIERIMARFKMNQAVIQCEAARWESHPEIAAPNSISRKDLRGLVDLARDHFIEPIPLVNVPGHAEWIFRNDQNLDLVEDPETPYAYCVNHPGSFAFIQDIMNEAIEIFEPTFFHLGHDEVTMRGQFPHPDCPRCQGETATTLVLKHLAMLHEWLEEREIGMMIWGDMMLAHDEIPDTAAFAPNVEEAKLRRAGIPENVVVTDWHYYEGEEYPSLGYFHLEGNPTIASTWYRPANIHYFARAALEYGSLGLLQTTWAGFFPDETVLATEFKQFTAFILAAEYAWTGRDELPAKLPFEAGTEFTRAFYPEGERPLAGRTFDLSEAAVTPRSNWLGLGDGWDFAKLPVGESRLGDVVFDVPEDLVVVGGPLAPDGARKRVTFQVDGEIGQVGQLALLNAAAFDAPDGGAAARLTVTYEDGSAEEADLQIGRTTAFWGKTAPTLRAPVGWQSLSPAETPIALRVTRWINPRPEEVVVSVSFSAADPEQAWALAGLTILE